MQSKFWRWALGLIYIFAVATIWIAASFVVQSVVDGGVSPFFITYICNSLFVIYLPLVEIGRYIEDKYGSSLQNKKNTHLQELEDLEKSGLLGVGVSGVRSSEGTSPEVEEEGANSQNGRETVSGSENFLLKVGSKSSDGGELDKEVDTGLDSKGRWTRTRLAKVSLTICPFWFIAQLTFNISLKYTTVTSNTILSSASSLFTFLVSLVFLDEKFTWLKLISVLLCMVGTIVVSLGDSESSRSAVASNPLLGDSLALLSAMMYAVYITLIRKKLPDDDDEKNGHVSMAQFLGFLGLFNLCIFLPVAVLLLLTKLEPLNMLTWKQFGLVIGKGLLDNVLSDYLWAKAILLTTTTVASAGLSIQVPLAAIVDYVTGNAPHPMDCVGALAVMIGFVGINIPSDFCGGKKENANELNNIDTSVDQQQIASVDQGM